MKVLFFVVFVFPLSLLGQDFINVANQIGLTGNHGPEIPAGGISTVDFNGDGWDDVSLATGDQLPLLFYQNVEGKFQQVLLSGIDNQLEAKQLLWADYDNDGDQDLLVTSKNGPDKLYNNQGDLAFIDATESAGLSTDSTTAWGASWSDYNRDGWLDLLVSIRQVEGSFDVYNRFYENQGDGSFIERAVEIGIDSKAKAPFCVAFPDMDNDMWPDLYIAQDRNFGNDIYRNTGSGKFQNQAATSSADIRMNGMSIGHGDYDNNGYNDIYVTNTSEGNKLLKNLEKGVFREVAANSGVGFFKVGWGANFFDYDNDADLDLFVNGSNYQIPSTSSFYINDGKGVFEEQSVAFLVDSATSFSNAILDFNRDGNLDIVVNNPLPYELALWENQQNSRNWIKFNLQGTISNRDAIGSRVEIHVGANKQIRSVLAGEAFLAQNTRTVSFGVRNTLQIDSVVVFWPSGLRSIYRDLATNSTYDISESEAQVIELKIIHERSGLCGLDSIYISSSILGKEIEYLWSDGFREHGRWVKESGDYKLSISHPQFGTLESEVLPISGTSESVPEVVVQSSDVTCYDKSDGMISLNIEPGLPYSVSWSNGAEGPILNDLKAGFYEAKIEFQNGCQRLEQVIISDYDSISGRPTFFQNDEDYDIFVEVYGGKGPYSFDWSIRDNWNSPIITGVKGGEVSVNIEDSNGCSASETWYLDIITSLVETQTNRLVIYPNPAIDILNVVVAAEDQIETIMVYNANGVLMQQASGRNSAVDISHLNKGNYIVVVTTYKDVYRHKVQKL